MAIPCLPITKIAIIVGIQGEFFEVLYEKRIFFQKKFSNFSPTKYTYILQWQANLKLLEWKILSSYGAMRSKGLANLPTIMPP